MTEEEVHPKRPREEEEEEQEKQINHPSHHDDSKRHKPLHNILNLLENVEDDDPQDVDDVSHDLTAIFTTLQQELSPASSSTSLPSSTVQDSDPSNNTLPGTGSDEDETAKSVIRHLLEASDDELGIPNRREDENCFEGIGSGEELGFNFEEEGGLWELEDETANYYTVLQAEFLM